MRNFEAYAEAGAEKISNNSRYDLQVSDMQSLLALEKEQGIIQALEKAFHAGIEAGARIERKEAAAHALDK